MHFGALIWRAAEGSQPGGGRLLDHTAISMCITFAAKQDMWCQTCAEVVALTVICSGGDDAEMRPTVNRLRRTKSEWNSPAEDDGGSPAAGSMPGASGFGLCCRPWRWSRCCGLPPGLPELIGITTATRVCVAFVSGAVASTRTVLQPTGEAIQASAIPSAPAVAALRMRKYTFAASIMTNH